jgi:hypothetical protein
MSKPAPVSVVETPEFLAATKRIMDEQERSQLVDHLARNPLARDLDLLRKSGEFFVMKEDLDDQAEAANEGI